MEARLECLDRCLGELPPETRELVLRYYQGGGGDRMKARATLAADLGVSPGVLRLRLHRIRARLHVCVRKCLARREMSGAGAPPIGEDSQ
jgi:DNA-directed RNA polymerase specialized sigma24 family protein